MVSIRPEVVRDRTNADPEFRLAARYWDCTLVLEIGRTHLQLVVRDGRVAQAAVVDEAAVCDVRIAAPEEDWKELLSTVPRPWYQDIFSAENSHGFRIEGDLVRHLYPYYRAVRRIIAVLRQTMSGPPPPPDMVPDVDRRFDTAVGRYLYVHISGVQYRVYYEEAGDGIPLVLQHTAGADGRQWRHVLEDPDFQKQFRMIAYDLPYHGKSLPPTGIPWWQQEYRLTRAFLMESVVAISRALGLDRPVYMGCSIGGHLAPDLALYHPEAFRAVIGINAGLVTSPRPGDDKLESFYHPRINSEWKAAMMFASMSPSSPEPYCRETYWIYSQGAPPVLKGDVFYYAMDHDLTGLASRIDTSKVDVYLLTAEYDVLSSDAGTPQLARQIPGAKYRVLPGMGHFGPSENPAGFKKYLAPVLDEIHTKYA